MTVWLIMWRYGDGSDSGIIDRAFTDQEEARWVANTLINQTGSNNYSLLSVEVK
jgi:hypothetical protein